MINMICMPTNEYFYSDGCDDRMIGEFMRLENTNEAKH